MRNDLNIKTDVFSIASQYGEMQTPGVHIDMITRNFWNIGSGDYFVALFNFPLRVNGLVANGCSYPGSTVYGDAYYHQNLWVVVCALSSTIGVPSSGYTTRNLRISGFYTPFYYLSAAEQTVTTYFYYFSSKYTSIGVSSSDGYPN